MDNEMVIPKDLISEIRDIMLAARSNVAHQVPSCVTSYMVSVRQARGLPVVSLFPHPASFRLHLAMDTLAFGYILPTTGRFRDFHPLETCAARRTTQRVSQGTSPDSLF